MTLDLYACVHLTLCACISYTSHYGTQPLCVFLCVYVIRSEGAAAVGLLVGGRVGSVHLVLSAAQDPGRPMGRGPQGCPDERPAFASH